MDSAQINKFLSSENADVRELAEQLLKLRAAVEKHRAKTGHELCWMNDVELWSALGGTASYPHSSLPVRDEFLKQCSRYHESRLKGSPYAEPQPAKTVT